MLLTGTVSAAPAAYSSYRTTAPSGADNPAEYALQPPGGAGDEEPEDSTSFEAPIPEPGSVKFPPVPPPPGVFGAPDTTTKRDSLSGFPQTNEAPVETIGPRPIVSGKPTSKGAAQNPPERTLFGLTPLALVAGLIALHIVIVSMVVK